MIGDNTVEIAALDEWVDRMEQAGVDFTDLWERGTI